ncbi:MAG: sigma-54-dependent Fis family transcriptional regulator [Alphaproteobacteria bacterium]|nr:sigma-54-dependent Fis family transcriptional regulator [Alphaproteobacteria bacterium]MBO4644574.1 sigma-54-dependent Fis family transcriptional regulator [Alphaproteobacteria bacterium]
MRLLLIGAMDGQIGAASQIAIKKGGSVALAESVDQALELLRSGQSADLIMADVKLDIYSLVERLDAERICVPVVACGVAADARSAVKAIKAGAKEYIPLPPDAELIGAVLSAFSMQTTPVIYKDKAMEQVLQLAKQIAPSTASVLITGESGTGKEVIAKYIHANSKRSSAPFVAVNCAAIPENLLESELFGYEKGAFTGAVARRIGKFEEADGGTLLLDEISEMDIRLQAKLLRVLQERQIDRIGGKKPINVDVRILATSNRNMQQEVLNKTFREDLYFRLNVVNISIPSLRQRKDDILPLTEYFIKKYSEMNDIPVKPLSKKAADMLLAYGWQGNVRELENTIHRAVLLSTGSEIAPEAIMLTGSMEQPRETEESSSSENMVGRTVADVEKDLIISTLKHTLGNRTHAANILGISIRTLRNKLKQYMEEGTEVPAAPNDFG